ncbi:MAG: hypothetical protein JHD23_10600 [Akkermansiaceae bacterium]|nr:hypothetical protein [Akkermansiaceae bacterium]MBJ7424927.1 hypothetical protein [Akkermansiaceae bacterium]
MARSPGPQGFRLKIRSLARQISKKDIQHGECYGTEVGRIHMGCETWASPSREAARLVRSAGDSLAFTHVPNNPRQRD